MTSTSGGPPVRKHLMTPGSPRRHNTEPMSLGRVQRWVMSTLAATTILHMSMGLVVAAAFAERTSAKIGLLVIGAAFGIVAMVAALVIHQRSPVSTWLLLGLIPAVVGSWFVF